MFITIEGIDGCGKSTQSARLAQWLKERTASEVIRTFEPGGYPDGGKLREFLLEDSISPMPELLLFLADRARHVDEVIAPAISAGSHVICERWNESTLAYQSGWHGLDFSRAKSIIDACAFPEPDAKIFLDVPPEIAFSRVAARTKSDRFEAEGLALMKRVSSFYRWLESMIRIDCGAMDEDEVFASITRELEARLWLFR
ncbi:MAG: dTMP kinase [Synergistaceae bacterium]|nr:dTMP kinase [Synergistaceae bacterium]